jgi:lactate permease
VFVQVLTPLGSAWGAAVVALIPLAVLLVYLAGLRLSAWAVVLLSTVMTLWMAVTVWRAPTGQTLAAYGLGAATGLWSVAWIIFWGLVIYNTLVVTGGLDALRDWLVALAGPDVRVQVVVLAWAFGALLEGLVGFGYPWAVVAPMLVGLGLSELRALRAAAFGNIAPATYGALGAPVIGLAAVTGLPLGELSATIGKLVAVLAIVPPFLLIYLVSGRAGLRSGWPLGAVGAAGFIVGQLPTSQYFGPYLPAVVGALTCLAALRGLLRYWQPPPVPGYPSPPGTSPPETSWTEPFPLPITTAQATPARRWAAEPPGALAASAVGRAGSRLRAHRTGLMPIIILVAVVVVWTGPWSPLPRYVPVKLSVHAAGSLGAPVNVTFSWAPFVAGTATLTAWLLIVGYLLPGRRLLASAFRRTLRQAWGALLVAPLIFGLTAVFNYSGMANSLANAFAGLGPAFILLAPVLGWIAAAMSGSVTSANNLFGAFQLSVGQLLGTPSVLFPSLNSIGAAVGKPIAPQTVSVGVCTTSHVRREGTLVRRNLLGTLGLLGFLIIAGLVFFLIR